VEILWRDDELSLGVVVSSSYFNEGPSEECFIVPIDPLNKIWNASLIQHVDKKHLKPLLDDKGYTMFFPEDALTGLINELVAMFELDTK